MASLGTQMKMAKAASGVSGAVGKATSSASRAAAGATRDEGEKKKLEIGDFMDDLMEGFAELYRLAVNGGQTCGDCVRKTTYPIKEPRYADRECTVHAPHVS
eukprot:s662_g28.t1